MLGKHVENEDDGSEDSTSCHDEDDNNTIRADEDNMSWQERVGMLLNRAGTTETHRELLKDAKATTWLLSSLRRELLQSEDDSYLKRSIHATVLRTLRGCGPKPTKTLERA
jgi:hypothetical protein